MTIPKKRLISGMNGFLAEGREDILRLFPRDLEVQRIGAKVDSIVPDKFSGRAYPNLFECVSVSPDREDASSGQVGEIDRPRYSIIEFKFQSEIRQGFYFNDLSHFRLPALNHIIEQPPKKSCFFGFQDNHSARSFGLIFRWGTQNRVPKSSIRDLDPGQELRAVAACLFQRGVKEIFMEIQDRRIEQLVFSRIDLGHRQ